MRPLANKLPSSIPLRPRQPCRSIRPQKRYNAQSTEPPNKKPHEPPQSQPQPQPQSQSQSPSFSSSPPHPQPSGTVASSAGASPAPLRARSLREVIYAGPLGRLGRAYARVQERRPYATQLCSSVVVYLCGDLSAQMLFPSEVVRKEGDAEGEVVEGGYDPWRTMRHLTVGVGSSIPSYNWYSITIPPGLYLQDADKATGSCSSTTTSTFPRNSSPSSPKSASNKPSSPPSSTHTSSPSSRCSAAPRSKIHMSD